MNIRLRPATAEDESFLLAVYASTRAEEMALVAWNAVQQDSFVRMQFSAQRASYAAQFPNAEHSIIVEDERDIGRMMVDRSGGKILLIDVALLPQFRGAGIGSALLQQLLDEASRIHQPILLHVDKSNRALRLYQRLGFAIAGENDIYVEMIWKPTAALENARPPLCLVSALKGGPMLGTLTKLEFDKHLNSNFRMHQKDGQVIELRLVECSKGRSGANYECFSLLFRGPKDRVLPQGTFELEHGELGLLPLFLVPVRQEREGTYYESVFNRLRQNAV